MAPPKIRGAIAGGHALLMLLGYCIGIYAGLGFYFVSGHNQWRGILGIQMVLPIIILCGIYWMPESPRYLLSKDRIEEAWAITKRLHVVGSDPGSHEFAAREFYQMRKQIELDNRYRTSYLGIFTKPSLRKRAIMTIFLEFSIYSCGVLVLLSSYMLPFREISQVTQLTAFHTQTTDRSYGLALASARFRFSDSKPASKQLGLSPMRCPCCGSTACHATGTSRSGSAPALHS